MGAREHAIRLANGGGAARRAAGAIVAGAPGTKPWDEGRAFTVAEFDAGPFSFAAYGADEADCTRLLEEAWARHAEATGADPGYLGEYRDGINFHAAATGQVFRDGSPI